MGQSFLYNKPTGAEAEKIAIGDSNGKIALRIVELEKMLADFDQSYSEALSDVRHGFSEEKVPDLARTAIERVNTILDEIWLLVNAVDVEHLCPSHRNKWCKERGKAGDSIVQWMWNRDAWLAVCDPQYTNLTRAPRIALAKDCGLEWLLHPSNTMPPSNNDGESRSGHSDALSEDIAFSE